MKENYTISLDGVQYELLKDVFRMAQNFLQNEIARTRKQLDYYPSVYEAETIAEFIMDAKKQLRDVAILQNDVKLTTLTNNGQANTTERTEIIYPA